MVCWMRCPARKAWLSGCEKRGNNKRFVPAKHCSGAKEKQAWTRRLALRLARRSALQFHVRQVGYTRGELKVLSKRLLDSSNSFAHFADRDSQEPEEEHWLTQCVANEQIDPVSRDRFWMGRRRVGAVARPIDDAARHSLTQRNGSRQRASCLLSGYSDLQSRL